MNSSRRRKTCARPIRKVSHTSYRKLKPISRNLLDRVRQILPDTVLDENTLLCGVCAVRLNEALETDSLLDVLTVEYGGVHDDDRQLQKVVPKVSSTTKDKPRNRRLGGLLPARRSRRISGRSVVDNGSSEDEDNRRDRSPMPGPSRDIDCPNNDISITSDSELPGTSGSSLHLSECTASSRDSLSQATPDRLNQVLKALKVPTVTDKVRKSPWRIKNIFKRAARNLLSEFNNVDDHQLDNVRAFDCPTCQWLLNGCKPKFKDLNSKKEKYLLLTLFKDFGQVQMQRHFGCTRYEASKAISLREELGPFSFPTLKAASHPINQVDINTIQAYYRDDSNSRVSPRMNDTILVLNKQSGVKERLAKRLMLCTLRELYKSFKEEVANFPTGGIKIGISKFAMLKPKECRWAGSKGYHNVCLCIVHENFKFLMQFLGEDVHQINRYLGLFLCSVPAPDCYLGYCSECPKLSALEDRYDMEENEIRFPQWENTDRNIITEVSFEPEDFKVHLRESVKSITKHHFIMKEQKRYVDQVKENLKKESAILVTVDFAENYRFVMQDSVQGVHWSNDSATLHPFVVYFFDDAAKVVRHKAFVAISDSGEHSAQSYHCFVSNLYEEFGDEEWFTKARKVYYVSDGAGSQYKNRYNFTNLVHHEKDFQKPAEWIFSATAHGKSMCDAIAGVVKRSVRLASLRDSKRIYTALDVFQFCKQKLATEKLQFFYVSNEAVQFHKTKYIIRSNAATTILGTRKYHSFIPIKNVLRCKITSTIEEYHDFHFDASVSVPHLKLGEYVAIRTGTKFSVGKVQGTHQEGEEVEYEVVLFVLVGAENRFKQSDARAPEMVADSEVIMRLRKPKFVSPDELVINEQQYEDIVAKLGWQQQT